MKSQRNYQENEVVDQLNKKHDLVINRGSNVINILVGDRAKNDVGIKSKGKIDFLVNYKGYIRVTTNKF